MCTVQTLKVKTKVKPVGAFLCEILETRWYSSSTWIQLASFHPQYQFDGESSEASSHFTNRSPYPMIHFLREDMMARLLQDFPNPEQIPQRNIETLDAIDPTELQRRLDNLA